MQRVSKTRRLVLLRDDHIGDRLGEIFLDQSEGNAERIGELVRGYLGRRVRLRKLELTPHQVEVEVEVSAMPDEAERLAAAAHNLRIKGAPRNALELYREALALDPLSSRAASGLGMLQVELRRYDEAFANLKRARESGPESADLLLALGQVALMLGREASAIGYLERGLGLVPRHFGIRRLLTDLGQNPKPAPRIQPAAGRSKPAADSRKR